SDGGDAITCPLDQDALARADDGAEYVVMNDDSWVEADAVHTLPRSIAEKFERRAAPRHRTTQNIVTEPENWAADTRFAVSGPRDAAHLRPDLHRVERDLRRCGAVEGLELACVREREKSTGGYFGKPHIICRVPRKRRYLAEAAIRAAAEESAAADHGDVAVA